MSKNEEQDQYIAVRIEDIYGCGWMIGKAFKEECQRLGAIYNRRFTAFNIETYLEYTDLYFSYGENWSHGGKNPKRLYFSLSSKEARQKAYQIPSQWTEAIEAVKTLLNDRSNHKNL